MKLQVTRGPSNVVMEERFVVETVVRRYHVYKDVWKPRLGELLQCKMEFGNIYDPYAVAVVRDDGGEVVGHIPARFLLCATFSLKEKVLSFSK